jgi:hypothetical protein
MDLHTSFKSMSMTLAQTARLCGRSSCDFRSKSSRSKSCDTRVTRKKTGLHYIEVIHAIKRPHLQLLVEDQRDLTPFVVRLR